MIFEASGNCSVFETTVTLTGVGECAISAYQPGNDAGNPAPDVSQSFAILRGTQTVTLDNPGDYTYADNLTVPLNASASSGLPVTFIVVDDNACSAVENANAVVTNQGYCEVKAIQEGNNDYFPAESAPVGFWINSAPGAFVWDDILPDRTYPADETFEVNATIIAGAAVTFFSGSYDVCDVSNTTFDGNIATTTVIIKGPGICTLEAFQSDSQNHFGAGSITKSFEVVSSSSSSTPATP